MNCKICDSPMEHVFEHLVLGKHTGRYLSCSACGYMTVEDPIWLEEAYSKPITDADTGLLSRNQYFAPKIGVLIDTFLDSSAQFLDYAGGYGVFTRLMRDAGFFFFHQDIYTQNIFAKGLEYDAGINVFRFEALTCFECLEHFVDPLLEVEKLTAFSKNLFFSTQLKSSEVPSLEWDYYGFEHGQHVSFFSEKSLQVLAEKLGFNFYTTGYLHFFTKLEISQKKFKKVARFAERRPNLFTKRTRFEIASRRLQGLREKAT